MGGDPLRPPGAESDVEGVGGPEGTAPRSTERERRRGRRGGREGIGFDTPSAPSGGAGGHAAPSPPRLQHGIPTLIAAPLGGRGGRRRGRRGGKPPPRGEIERWVNLRRPGGGTGGRGRDGLARPPRRRRAWRPPSRSAKVSEGDGAPGPGFNVGATEPLCDTRLSRTDAPSPQFRGPRKFPRMWPL